MPFIHSRLLFQEAYFSAIKNQRTRKEEKYTQRKKKTKKG